MAVEPYTISVPDEDLEKLSQRLALTRYPDQLESDDHWEFGSPVSDVKRLASYWKDGFDWRKAEAKINELPNFMTSIEVDGFGAIDVHFVHQVSPVAGAIPLLFSHGWPGSFLEVTKLLPLLKGGDDLPAFHVVALSLPNFGFSGVVNKKGFGTTKYAETCHKLMLKLGYNEYVTQGGDWGFETTRAMGLQYPSHCKASHINLILANPPQFTKTPILALQHALTAYTQRDRSGRARTIQIDRDGIGYNILQSTKPQTIGYSLADSPVGLLAWIYEKLHDWTDAFPWTDDEILTWVSIYWFSKAGPASSVRIYYEATHAGGAYREPAPGGVSMWTLRDWIPRVKLGIAHFPQEINIVPKTWAATLGPVCYQSEHARGGHFAAWEVPDAIAGDLRNMFGKGGTCFGVIEGKSGF